MIEIKVTFVCCWCWICTTWKKENIFVRNEVAWVSTMHVRSIVFIRILWRNIWPNSENNIGVTIRLFLFNNVLSFKMKWLEKALLQIWYLFLFFGLVWQIDFVVAEKLCRKCYRRQWKWKSLSLFTLKNRMKEKWGIDTYWFLMWKKAWIVPIIEFGGDPISHSNLNTPRYLYH